MLRTWLGILAAALVVSGCGQGAGPVGGNTQPLLTNCGAEFPKGQGGSHPCCPDWGDAACGAGYFCAAFDAVTQPICRADHSRGEGQSCTADIECANSSCNVAAGKCRADAPYACDPDVGCAATSHGVCVPCVDGRCAEPASDGQTCTPPAADQSFCTRNPPCASGYYCGSSNICVPAQGSGSRCAANDACRSGVCVFRDSSGPAGICDDPSGLGNTPCGTTADCPTHATCEGYCQ